MAAEAGHAANRVYTDKNGDLHLNGAKMFDSQERSAQSPAANLTALAGGGQAGATPLTSNINHVGTVVTAADSVLLPAAVAGTTVYVINAAAANAMAVFPATGETINALSANTSISVAANKVIHFICPIAGKWFSLLTA